MSVLSLRLPNSIHEKVKELTKKDHVSINQFISSAVAEKLSAMMTEDYIYKRGLKGNRAKYLKALNKAPDVKPEKHDEL